MLEIVLVIGIIGIISNGLMPNMRIIRENSIKNEVRELERDIFRARNYSILENEGYKVKILKYGTDFGYEISKKNSNHIVKKKVFKYITGASSNNSTNVFEFTESGKVIGAGALKLDLPAGKCEIIVTPVIGRVRVEYKK